MFTSIFKDALPCFWMINDRHIERSKKEEQIRINTEHMLPKLRVLLFHLSLLIHIWLWELLVLLKKRLKESKSTHSYWNPTSCSYSQIALNVFWFSSSNTLIKQLLSKLQAKVLLRKRPLTHSSQIQMTKFLIDTKLEKN